MKACLLILLLMTAQGSILVTENMRVTDFLFEYTTVTKELPKDLSQYAVIVISTPSTLYEESQIQAVKTFVESGGGLMLLAEENNRDGTTLVLNQLSQTFSVTFNTDRIYDDHSYFQHTSWITLTAFPSHPVFQGITTIVYTSGCSIEADGVLVKSSENAYSEKYDGLSIHEKGDLPACMAFLEIGKGRIFACGDKELFDTYLSLKDNTLFAMNVFDWLAGNTDRISRRLSDRDEASQKIVEAESLLQLAIERGLNEILPEPVGRAETLITEAKTLYDSYRYSDSLQKANEAKKTVETGEEEARKMVENKVKAVQECLSTVEVGAQKYLPSQLEAAQYYVREIEQQKTYLGKIERADSALELCNEISVALKGAAEKEINAASGKVESYRGLFGRRANHFARIYLEYAEESYNAGNFGNAIEYAQQSQIYSENAMNEQKKDYILLVVVILAGIVAVFIYVRK